MKKLADILLIIYIILFSSVPLYAKEEDIESDFDMEVDIVEESSDTTTTEDNLTIDTRYFEIELVREGQSAWNKAVTYMIYVTPKIDSKRTQIIWDTPTVIDVKPRHPEFVDLYKGETYSFKARIFSERAGTYEITVNIIAWQHDTNYTNSVSDIITFDDDLLAQPLDSGYTFGVIVKILVILSVIGLVIFLLVRFGRKGFVTFKHWLTPPI